MIKIQRVGDIPVFLITDQHLYHDNIRKFEGRPENFEATILKSLSKLPEESILIDLGDIIFGDKTEDLKKFISVCPSRTKVLCIGNHDRKSYSAYLRAGYNFVCEHFYWPGILFSHRPIAREYWPEGCRYNIHGHLHTNYDHYGIYGNPKKHEGHLLIALEDMGYKVKHINEILTHQFGIDFITPKFNPTKWMICLDSDRHVLYRDQPYDTYAEANKTAKELTKTLGQRYVIFDIPAE